ncbi:MAG: YeiH family protein [Bradymonadia bacterium]
MGNQDTKVWPGLFATAALAITALYIHKLPFAPFTIDGRNPVDALLVAIVLGTLLRNTMPISNSLTPGIKYSVKTLLPFAIVLMGAKLDFGYVVEVSQRALWISILCVIVAYTLTVWLCVRLGVGQKLGILIGIGTAICGGTAIAVSAPSIEADDSDTAFAITTITIFGLIAIFIFPPLGHLLGLSQSEFGAWSGIAIQATPQVMAAGFAYGQEAGEVAVIVKLVRVLLLAPMLLWLGIWYARQKRARQEAYVARRTQLSTLFPPFILGFITLAIANSANLLPDFSVHLKETAFWTEATVPLSMKTLVTQSSLFFVTMAMAGVGLGVHIKMLKRIGLKALYIGCFSAAVLAIFSLALIKLAG